MNEKSLRDSRIDVLRGIALLFIFVDHVPYNILGRFTLRNFGFCDAAEVFVLLAGFASMAAYGKCCERDGLRVGVKRVVRRICRLWVFQIALVLATAAVLGIWCVLAGLDPSEQSQIINQGWHGLLQCMTLTWLPSYLDILPLYIALLALFPLIYVGFSRLGVMLTLIISASVWLIAGFWLHINLPSGDGGWFFNPLSWQFLFAVGAAGYVLIRRHNNTLPRLGWLVWPCAAFLIVSLVGRLGLFDLPHITKTHLSPLRLLNVLALMYVVLSSATISQWLRSSVWRLIEICGKHSLEVFSLGTVLSLIGMLVFESFGTGLGPQLAVNIVGIAMLISLAGVLEQRRVRA